jgi:hypothetical protein
MGTVFVSPLGGPLRYRQAATMEDCPSGRSSNVIASAPFRNLTRSAGPFLLLLLARRGVGLWSARGSAPTNTLLPI